MLPIVYLKLKPKINELLQKIKLWKNISSKSPKSHYQSLPDGAKGSRNNNFFGPYEKPKFLPETGSVTIESWQRLISLMALMFVIILFGCLL